MQPDKRPGRGLVLRVPGWACREARLEAGTPVEIRVDPLGRVILQRTSGTRAHRPFSDEEDDRIASLRAEGLSAGVIARTIHRSERATRQRVRHLREEGRLKDPPPRPPKWTPLPPVHVELGRLELVKTRRTTGNEWTVEEITKLRELVNGGWGKDFLVRVLRRRIGTIRAKATELGLPDAPRPP